MPSVSCWHSALRADARTALVATESLLVLSRGGISVAPGIISGLSRDQQDQQVEGEGLLSVVTKETGPPGSLT